MRLSVDYWLGLNAFLSAYAEDEVTISFDRIENLLGHRLPKKFKEQGKYWQERKLFPRTAGFSPTFKGVEAGSIRFVRMSEAEIAQPWSRYGRGGVSRAPTTQRGPWGRRIIGARPVPRHREQAQGSLTDIESFGGPPSRRS
ncbi:MAG: hypothetical protein FJZ00_06110, partial [Candidatus Sericytochromatia bacterium]|nr:hypothetical protein [Candidatus Tanganyikabacteria bacterium]